MDRLSGLPRGGPYDRLMPKVVLADRPLTEPHPSRLDPRRPDRQAILAAHAAAMAADDDGYVDPSSGLFVFTARYLARRGSCCDTACRHCPYVS
jgi:hypothetical protein